MKKHQGKSRQGAAEQIVAKVAQTQGFELVEVTLQKENDGLALCIYIDRDGGITLDDCERFHKAVQPLLDGIAYDYLEVSSPGADRPIQSPSDFEKHKGERVEVRLFAKQDGVKQFTGALTAMDEETVTITTANGQEMDFPRKGVALIKPVIILSEDEEE